MPHTFRRLALLLGIVLIGSLVAIRATRPLEAQAQAQISDADTLPTPNLQTDYEYADLELPAHFTTRVGRNVRTVRGGGGNIGGGGRGGQAGGGRGNQVGGGGGGSQAGRGRGNQARGGRGDVIDADNTPDDNPITNAGATLGRVLFYDVRLSADNTVACASCHQQEHNFSDPRTLSVGVNGQTTARHAMSLANARFNAGGFFWDARAATLEMQVLMPIASDVEMNMPLATLETKLARTDFYPDLFDAAFGDDTVTSDRIAKALAQFVRSLVSANSEFDRALLQERRGEQVLNQMEQLGRELFDGRRDGRTQSVPCSQCHRTAIQITSSQAGQLDREGRGGRGGRAGRGSTMNIGLDTNPIDQGAGGGRFRAPSLRNIEVSAPYMHDGRFETLEAVIDHYSEGIQPSQALDARLRDGREGDPLSFAFNSMEKAALVAFLKTLTDERFLKDPKFSDPFGRASRN